ncbi:MAG: BatA domain-containing protein [Gloeobacteraceae cyanobacterium ES-bin-144]|nr:BatA domain-containing protein [Verrucomicrobiales bacterium]
MGFLSPFMLVSAAVLGVPLWLHLRRKRRQTPVEFPSLRYLKMAAARMKRQARVEDLGLLLLRLLLVALLVAAFARPVMRSSGGWLGAARSTEAVIVIDATASMSWRGEAGTRLDAAKRLAREWIEGLDPSDAVALWVLTDKLEQPVPVPISDRAFLFKQIDSLTPSEGSSSLAPVFNAAREWAESHSAGRKELMVVTDNQAAAWDWPADGFFKHTWKRGGMSLVVLTPDTKEAANLSVESVEWDGKAVRAGAILSGIARLANHGDAAAKDLLEVRIRDQVMFRRAVEIPSGGSVDVPLSFLVPSSDELFLSGEIALAGDALVSDDRWYFTLPIRHAANSIVVDRAGEMAGGTRASFFLMRALAAGGAGKVTVVDSAAWSKQNSAGMDAIWFTGGAVSNEAVWSKALNFAEAGGTLVVTGDSQPAPMFKEWPVTTGEEISLPAGRIATRLLVPSHPVFEGIWSEQAPFPPLPQRTARRCDAVTGAKVLATLAGELPLLVESAYGKGRIIWLNASADRSWGDLPLSPVYVALVQQLAWSTQLARQSKTSLWVGEAWPDLTKLSEDAAWPLPPDGGPSTRALRSGVFDAVSKDGKSQWRCAVNIRRAESDIRPLESHILQQMLPGRLMTGGQGLRGWREELRREVPLWPWLLGAAALTFLAEGWLSSIAAERREMTAGNVNSKPIDGRNRS